MTNVSPNSLEESSSFCTAFPALCLSTSHFRLQLPAAIPTNSLGALVIYNWQWSGGRGHVGLSASSSEFKNKSRLDLIVGVLNEFFGITGKLSLTRTIMLVMWILIQNRQHHLDFELTCFSDSPPLGQHDPPPVELRSLYHLSPWKGQNVTNSIFKFMICCLVTYVMKEKQ